MIPARVTLRIISLIVLNGLDRGLSASDFRVHSRSECLPPLTHKEMLYLSVWRRALSYMSRSTRVRESRARRLNSVRHRSTVRLIPWLPIFSTQIRRGRNTRSIPFAEFLIKRHGRVSALKCMRETDRVSIREPASCEHLRLSDLNNGLAD